MWWIVQYDAEMLDKYTHSACAVYGYLWWNTWKSWWNGMVRPSIWLMQKTLHMGYNSIVRGIRELEKWKLIEVDRYFNRKNEYYIVDMHNYPACANWDDTDWD